MARYQLFILAALFALVNACQAGGSPPIMGEAEVREDFVPSQGGIPSVSTSLQKLTYKVGPFNLPAGQRAETMWESPGSIDFQTNDPLWVVSFEPTIEDGGGNELPPELLHLAILANSSERNPLCTEKDVANPFMAATSVTKKIALPDGIGYPVNPTDQLDAKVILQNPTAQDYSNVYFKFQITAVPMKNAKGYKDVAPLMLNVDPCDYYPISVAPKEFLKKGADFIVPESGLLTKAYGLLQNYGVSVALSAKDQPTPFWDAKARQDQDHKIIELTPFEDPAGIPLKSGDGISLTVVYDNPVDSWQNNATGAVMAYIVRTEEKGSTDLKNSKTLTTEQTQSLLLR